MSLSGNALRIPSRAGVLRLSSRVLTAVPLFVVRLVLNRIATELARAHPDLFARMGAHTRKRILIDPAGFPFVFLLVPDTAAPRLEAYDCYESVSCDATVTGNFMTLLDMVAGSLDGDALFFSRDLHVTGDVETIVALRNALDDFDGDLLPTILNALGPLSVPASLTLAAVRGFNRNLRHA
jgi:predicted lipid carrier protein YhbT